MAQSYRDRDDDRARYGAHRARQYDNDNSMNRDWYDDNRRPLSGRDEDEDMTFSPGYRGGDYGRSGYGGLSRSDDYTRGDYPDDYGRFGDEPGAERERYIVGARDEDENYQRFSSDRRNVDRDRARRQEARFGAGYGDTEEARRAGYGYGYGQGSQAFGSDQGRNRRMTSERGYGLSYADVTSAGMGSPRNASGVESQYGQRQGPFRGKGPKAYQRSDDRIREDINDRLTDDEYLDASDIEVKVKDCEITLGGFVSNRADKRRAEDCAEQVSGVKHVQNNLRIRENQQMQAQAGENRQQGGQQGGSRRGASQAGASDDDESDMPGRTSKN